MTGLPHPKIRHMFALKNIMSIGLLKDYRKNILLLLNVKIFSINLNNLSKFSKNL